jgi:hypothetical protein
MTFKVDAKQVKDLALGPYGPCIDTSLSRHGGLGVVAIHAVVGFNDHQVLLS